jgi:acylphosphatase
MNNKRVHVYIEGHVQGVFFRETTRQQAAACGACGWVRNMPDGRVEAVIEGGERVVSQMLEFVHNGPSRSRVTNVSVFDETFTGEFDSFRIVG